MLGGADAAGQGGQKAAFISTEEAIGPLLMQVLMAPEIQPGTDPGYQLCKTIYTHHPLGAVLTDAPYRRAQSKPRNIDMKILGSDRLIEQRQLTWDSLGTDGGTVLLFDLFSTARRYGIAALAVGERGKDTSTPLDITKIADADLYFNIFDPLNTAGSLVLSQDPNSPSFMKPSGMVRVNGEEWHPSRLSIKMHERPIYIDFTTSAFGFVGRSVYQRALYALKTFIQSMITDQMVVQKAGMLVYKAQSPSSFVDNIMQWFMGLKRAALKQGTTGQVFSIGVDESIETLNFTNLEGPYNLARMNVLKNIATAAGMPASIIAQETLTEGFGEGTEDFKKEVEYLDNIRQEMAPHYRFLDAICNRKAWTPEFYATLGSDYKEYGEGGYERALADWLRSFRATWPNLLTEPDSEKVKTEEIQMKSVIALAEVILPEADPATKAKLLGWIAENVNNREMLFSGELDIDVDEIQTYFEEHQKQQDEAMARAGEEPDRPRPFSAAS